MNNKKLTESLKKKDGFWIRIRDLNDEVKTGCLAKIKFDDDNNIRIYTLLEDAPAINIYPPEDFAFYSGTMGVLLMLNGKGDIYDYYDPFDADEDLIEYTENFLKKWGLSEEEYLEHLDLSTDEEIPKMMFLRTNRKIEEISAEEANKYREMIGLPKLDEEEIK